MSNLWICLFLSAPKTAQKMRIADFSITQLAKTPLSTFFLKCDPVCSFSKLSQSCSKRRGERSQRQEFQQMVRSSITVVFSLLAYPGLPWTRMSKVSVNAASKAPLLTYAQILSVLTFFHTVDRP